MTPFLSHLGGSEFNEMPKHHQQINTPFNEKNVALINRGFDDFRWPNFGDIEVGLDLDSSILAREKSWS